MMGQFDDKVERQRQLLKAEKWAAQVKDMHAHQLTSMYYETDETVNDTKDGAVMDIRYNDGLIERHLPSGELRYFGERLTGDELIREYVRKNSDKPKKRYVYI